MTQNDRDFMELVYLYLSFRQIVIGVLYVYRRGALRFTVYHKKHPIDPSGQFISFEPVFLTSIFPCEPIFFNVVT